MITRDEAFVLIKKYLRHEDNIRKSLAVEAILREIAKKLERNADLWGLTGLLHNIDYEYTSTEPESRGVLSAQLLEDLLPEKAVNAIKANNYTHTDYIPTTSLDKSLMAASVNFLHPYRSIVLRSLGKSFMLASVSLLHPHRLSD